MFITVKLLRGYGKPLTYRIPKEWNTKQLIGNIVRVPIRNQTAPALVIKTFKTLPTHSTFTIKEAVAFEPFPHDPAYYPFVGSIASYYHIDPAHIVKRIRNSIEQKTQTNDVERAEQPKPSPVVTLTKEQQLVVDRMVQHISNSSFTPALLHGVTGSGKTECYKRLIQHAIKENKSVVLLLPEVSLATTFTLLLRTQLPEIAIFGFHSATPQKEKRTVWNTLIQQKPILIIGVHLPILLPIYNLGLILIDEEHDVGFQEKQNPKINSKEAALIRAQVAGIPILLGSATPSISSFYNVKKRNWKLFSLTKRFIGTFPKIQVVPLNDKKQRRTFWISKPLFHAIENRLQQKEQVIIFINRRGFSFFVQCKSCSLIFDCPSCAVSLTLHEQQQLQCHYCGYHQQQPTNCSQCNAPEKQFLKKGIGTQQVVQILQRLFPRARIARADMDNTVDKKRWQALVHDMNEGTIDILVGTQTISKGYHFPKVTLVGMIWADLNLNFPIFNAAETTLQQLIQVAGRAGRNTQKSLVIAQTMIDHPIFQYLSETDYLKFYESEMASRKELNYPPYTRLVEINLKHEDEAIVTRDALELTKLLQSPQEPLLQVLGPATPPLKKMRNLYTKKIYIKCPSMNLIAKVFKRIDPHARTSIVTIIPNPVQL